MSTAISHGYLPAGCYIVNHDIMHCTAEGVDREQDLQRFQVSDNGIVVIPKRYSFPGH